MKKSYILVIIPFFGKINLILNFLDSLFKSYISGFAYQVVLWNDGTSKEELDELKKFTNNYIGIISNEKNVGYTLTVYNAVNYAKERKEFDYLLLANNDIKLFPGTLTSLVKRISTNINISAVGCKILHWIDNIIIHTGTRIQDGKIIDPYCGLDINNPITNNVERRLWTNGCCTIYNLDILRKENLNFDLSFSFFYFEESDLMSRLNLLGYSVLYEPKAMVRHLVNGTTRERQGIQGIFENNWKLYLSKWEKYFREDILYFQ